MAIPLCALPARDRCPARSAYDVRDLEGSERLAMAALAAVVLAALELEDDDLRPEPLPDDLRLDLRAANDGVAQLDRVARDEEHVLKGDRVAHVPGELLDPDLVARGDPVLLAARLEYRVHAWPALFVGAAPASRTRRGLSRGGSIGAERGL